MQDGLRFKSQQSLGAHLDALFVQNEENRRAKAAMATGGASGRYSRQWYWDADRWVSDSAASAKAGANAQDSSSGAGSSSSGQAAAKPEDDEEEMVVLADENFPRCPVSNEVFMTFWDEEEGDIMYRNAVRVILTASADPQLFSVSKPTSVEGVRYALVHKRLALDDWLARGKAVTVKDAMSQKFRESRADGASFPDYAAAAGVDDQETDVFVILPNQSDHISDIAESKS